MHLAAAPQLNSLHPAVAAPCVPPQASPQQWESAQQALLAAPAPASFARRHPTYDGVCMGNRKTCQCGAPFFS